MPIYEYKCSKCDKIHEIIQKFSDSPVKFCPNCKAPVTKLMSLSSFSLKGKGWYVTDYKKKPEPKETQETQKESSQESSKKSKKDTKTTEKKTSKKEADSKGSTKKESSKKPKTGK